MSHQPRLGPNEGTGHGDRVVMEEDRDVFCSVPTRETITSWLKHYVALMIRAPAHPSTPPSS
jgi:hypothetical protein